MKQAKTFGDIMKSPTERLNETLAALDSKLLAYQELVLIRERADNNTLKGELYTFLNQYGGLETLFQGFPPPSEDGKYSMEDLRGMQLDCLDVAIEGLLGDIKDFLMRLLHHFKEWVLDWIDTNRRMNFRLQQHLERLTNNRMEYGDVATFNKATGLVYHYTNEWEYMFKAASDMTEKIKHVPSTDVYNWLNTNQKDLASDLSHFGYSMTNTSCTNNGPRYVPTQRSLGDAHWSWDKIKTIVKQTKDHLDMERSNREAFDAIWKAFDKAIANGSTIQDKTAMSRLVRIVKVSKECSAVTARAVVNVCNIALRNA